MPKNNGISPAEAYASKKASEWVYDSHGYCSFTAGRFAGVIRQAYADGAASVMSTASLTPQQREAIVTVLNKCIAGGTSDLRDALGQTNAEAASMMRILNRVVEKLV